MKILMLHGYTQNARTFKIKLRALTKRVGQVYPGTQFLWPDGSIQLNSDDIPGYSATVAQDAHEMDLRAWFHLRYAQDPPNGLSQSINDIAALLEKEGPVDGVIAFSQGTIMAAFVASLLQGQVRRRAQEKASRGASAVMAYPESFAKLNHPPLKFGILCSARVGMEQYYDWMYQNPRIATPFCHVVGDLDPMVDVSEGDAALERVSGIVIRHAGGHWFPMDRKTLDRIMSFLGTFVDGRAGNVSEGWHPVSTTWAEEGCLRAR